MSYVGGGMLGLLFRAGRECIPLVARVRCGASSQGSVSHRPRGASSEPRVRGWCQTCWSDASPRSGRREYESATKPSHLQGSLSSRRAYALRASETRLGCGERRLSLKISDRSPSIPTRCNHPVSGLHGLPASAGNAIPGGTISHV